MYATQLENGSDAVSVITLINLSIVVDILRCRQSFFRLFAHFSKRTWYFCIVLQNFHWNIVLLGAAGELIHVNLFYRIVSYRNFITPCLGWAAHLHCMCYSAPFASETFYRPKAAVSKWTVFTWRGDKCSLYSFSSTLSELSKKPLAASAAGSFVGLQGDKVSLFCLRCTAS